MTLSRRTVLACAAATAGLAALPAHAKAPLAGTQAPGFFRMKLGEMEVTTINDGFFVRPLAGFVKNAMDEEVAAAIQDARLPGNGVFIPFTTVVINTGDKLVLIDCGNGDSGAPTSGRWMTNFKAAGFDPKDVDTVIISHFHGDHINGVRLKDGTAVFPNAEVMVPSAEWAFWMDDAKMSAAPDPMKPAFQNVRRVFGPQAKDVKQFEPGKEIAPGITSIAAGGHTPGHNVFMVASGNAKLMCLADTTNNPYLFARHPDWQAVFDMDGNAAAATRKKLLDMAAEEEAQVHMYHAPFPATGFIEKAGNGYDFVPVVWSSAL
ncbi:MAG TPA: MBL fold metallo-hydrolase [Beijerinckiaceae bacterium]|nr:MBL fold metallo-hydrolase [Beijerinckiaceae bacterium]